MGRFFGGGLQTLIRLVFGFEQEFIYVDFLDCATYIGVSKNSGTPKWMVYIEQPYYKWKI